MKKNQSKKKNYYNVSRRIGKPITHLSIEEQKNYIPLPSILKKNGFIYTLVKRGIKTMIYEQRDGEIVVGYEVFKNIISKTKNISGKIISPRELFPKNDDFRFTAWAPRTLEEAIIKFDELEKVKD
jgi:hypothetical protein